MTGRWREGERGRTGDHGQTGDTGRAGAAGETGRAGVAGPRGTNVTLGQFLAFALIVGAGYLGFQESEKNDAESLKQRDQIQRQQDDICVYQRENREALRQVYRDVANLGRQVSAGSDRRKALMESFDVFEADRLKSLEPIPEGCPK